MRKICGIPLFIIAILIGAGIAAATFTYIYKLDPTVRRPVSEQTNDTFDVAAGQSIAGYRTLDLVLPDTYNLTYKLTGDVDDYLEDESATIMLDYGEDGNFDAEETISLGENVTFSNVPRGQINQKINIKATARDDVQVTAEYNSMDDSPSLDIVTTCLQVSMELEKA